jgi:hypothetical protein
MLLTIKIEKALNFFGGQLITDPSDLDQDPQH